MSEVLYRATKYMNAEDALLAREEKPRKRERLEDARLDQGRKKPRTGERRDERRPKPPGGSNASIGLGRYFLSVLRGLVAQHWNLPGLLQHYCLLSDVAALPRPGSTW